MDDGNQECSSILRLPENSQLYDFLTTFAGVNEYIFAYLCIYMGPVNILVNIFVMIVLMSEELRSPYNLVFFLMALDQTIIIASLTITMFRGYVFLVCTTWYFSMFWAVFDLASQHLMICCISHTTWLAVIISSMRILSIRSQGRTEIRFKHVIILCSFSMTIIVLAHTTYFLSYTVGWKRMKDVCPYGEYGDVLIPVAAESPRVYINDCLLLRMSNLFTGFIHNTLPCMLLIVLLPTLMHVLRKARKERERLRQTSVRESQDGDRTTTLLILIMISTMVSEIPQAILYLLEGLLSSKMRVQITAKITTFVMSFILITSACNLFIYLFMSKKFREVAKSYVSLPCRKLRKIASLKGPASS